MRKVSICRNTGQWASTPWRAIHSRPSECLRSAGFALLWTVETCHLLGLIAASNFSRVSLLFSGGKLQSASIFRAVKVLFISRLLSLLYYTYSPTLLFRIAGCWHWCRLLVNVNKVSGLTVRRPRSAFSPENRSPVTEFPTEMLGRHTFNTLGEACKIHVSTRYSQPTHACLFFFNTFSEWWSLKPAEHKVDNFHRWINGSIVVLCIENDKFNCGKSRLTSCVS